jgi:DNA repair protein RadC
MSLKKVSKFDLPREKLEKYGAKKLADYELLAIILGSGIKGTNVLQLAKKVLRSIENPKKLNAIKGLGRAKGLQIAAVTELSERLARPKFVASPENIFTLCEEMRASKKEHLIAFYLGASGELITKETISIGTLSETLVHPREIFEPAIRHSAASVLLVHNHPSGEPKPSDADLDITGKIMAASELVGIDLLDHIIVTKGRFLSFKRAGLLSDRD